MLRVRRVRVYVDGGALLLPVDRHVLAATHASTGATDASFAAYVALAAFTAAM